MVTTTELRPGTRICETPFFRAFMSGENELTLQVLMVYPVGGRRWTKLYQGPPDAEEARAILADARQFAEDTRILAPANADDQPEPWYAGMYRQ